MKWTILLYTKIPWSVCLHINHGLSHNYCDDYGSYGIESRWSCNRASIFVQSIITWRNIAWEALWDSFFSKNVGRSNWKNPDGEVQGRLDRVMAFRGPRPSTRPPHLDWLLPIFFRLNQNLSSPDLRKLKINSWGVSKQRWVPPVLTSLTVLLSQFNLGLTTN